MEKTQAGSRRYPRNSGRAQDDRAVKWRAVDGKLLLDPGKKAVYSSSYVQLGLAHETFYRELKHLEEDGRLIRKKHIVRLR